MKKITFLFLFALIGTLQAQTVVWSDDFEDKKIDDWTLVDKDGDGKNWKFEAVQLYDEKTEKVVTYNAVSSRSAGQSSGWDEAPALTPDNYIISPKIDLTNVTGTITLKWKVSPTYDTSNNESYSVYVAKSKEVATLLASSVKTDKINLKEKKITVPTEQTLDLSSLAGEGEVYIAFRHYDSTKQDAIFIDDVSVEYGAAASTENLELANVNFSYNTSELKVSANDVLDSAEVFNILGKRTLNQKLSSKSESINISNLNSGIYILRVSAQGKYKTFKFVK